MPPSRFTSVNRSLAPKGPMFPRIAGRRLRCLFLAGQSRSGIGRGAARVTLRPVMAGRYGMSFAAKLIQEGKYAEAVEEASRAVARDDEDPAALVDRATAYAWLERYPEAVRDLEAALALDETAGVLETDVV